MESQIQHWSFSVKLCWILLYSVQGVETLFAWDRNPATFSLPGFPKQQQKLPIYKHFLFLHSPSLSYFWPLAEEGKQNYIRTNH